MGKRDDQAIVEPPPISTDNGRGIDLLLAKLQYQEARRRMVALTDRQLDLVMTSAAPLPPDKRGVLLERVAAHLQLYGRRRGRHFRDIDVECAVRSSLLGLAQSVT